MNTHLRRRLLADAAVNSHAHPARVDRAMRYGTGRYRRHVASVYAVVVTVSALVLVALVAVHPAARAVLNDIGAGSPVATESAAPTTAPPTGTPSELVLTSISIVPGAVTLAAGDTAQLGVVGNYSDGSSGPVAGVPVWTSDNETIASVTAAGVVTALVPDQSTSITASLTGLSDTTSVIVAARVLTRISIRSVNSSSDGFQKDLESDGRADLTVGDDAELVADGAYSDGTSAVLADVTWASDQPAVTVDSTGRVSAKAAGSAQITASLQGVVGTVTIDVSDITVIE